jgi:hypothetical protein
LIECHYSAAVAMAASVKTVAPTIKTVPILIDVSRQEAYNAPPNSALRHSEACHSA